MASGIVFKYGDYNFRPRPLLSISSEPLKTPDGSGYGILHTIQLQGDLLSTGTTELDSGLQGVSNKIEALKDALNADGKLFIVACNDDPFLSGYPTIEDYSINNESDNYTRRAGYNITLVMPTTDLGSGNDEFNGSTFPPFIESCEETWDVEFQDDRTSFDWTLTDGTYEKFGYKVAVTHTVNTQARLAYTGSQISNIPWEDALEYSIGRLGFDNDFVKLTGVLGLPGSGYFEQYDVFNNYRQVSTNQTEGSIQITETFIVSPSGSGSLPNDAIEVFDISTNLENGIVNVSIQGEIQGLEDISYTGNAVTSNTGFYVTRNKYDSASGYFNLVKGRLYDRAKTAYNGIAHDCYDRPLNPTPKGKAIGVNPLNGVITYSYDFDTKPSGCITGDCVISQLISIDDTLESDVFARHTILGRAVGPILQDLNTITERTRTVNVEIITLPPTSCASVSEIYKPVPTGQVDDFIAVVSGDLSSNYSQVFVSAQSQNWNFSNGTYTKSISFTYNNCTG